MNERVLLAKLLLDEKYEAFREAQPKWVESTIEMLCQMFQDAYDKHGKIYDPTPTQERPR